MPWLAMRNDEIAVEIENERDALAASRAALVTAQAALGTAQAALVAALAAQLLEAWIFAVLHENWVERRRSLSCVVELLACRTRSRKQDPPR